MFQCHSQPVPPSPFPLHSQVCSLHLRLYSCLASRFISTIFLDICSDEFSLSLVSDSVRPHGLQHARLRHPSPTPEACSNHVYRVSDAIQPSHPLSSSFSPAFNFSQHRGLVQWVSLSHQMAKVLEFQPQHQSFQWIFRTDFL